MSQSSSPEILPFTPDASFQLCDPGSACLKPRKMPEAARFRPIPVVCLGSKGVQFNYPQRQIAGIALGACENIAHTSSQPPHVAVYRDIIPPYMAFAAMRG